MSGSGTAVGDGFTDDGGVDGAAAGDVGCAAATSGSSLAGTETAPGTVALDVKRPPSFPPFPAHEKQFSKITRTGTINRNKTVKQQRYVSVEWVRSSK